MALSSSAGVLLAHAVLVCRRRRSPRDSTEDVGTGRKCSLSVLLWLMASVAGRGRSRWRRRARVPAQTRYSQALSVSKRAPPSTRCASYPLSANAPRGIIWPAPMRSLLTRSQGVTPLPLKDRRVPITLLLGEVNVTGIPRSRSVRYCWMHGNAVNGGTAVR